MVSKKTVAIVSAVAIFVVLSAFFARSGSGRRVDAHESHDQFVAGASQSGSCKSCSAIDPVLEPAYNLKNIAMQSVLLEEHLADPRKRCPSCICKHFLHIVGLAQEAVTLAGSRLSEYEYLDGLGNYYNTTFEDWKKNKKCNNNIQSVGERLRKMRNQITKVYVLDS
jgi:hypothetical protein